MGALPDLHRRMNLSTTGKVRLIVMLFVIIAICLTGMIQLQGNIFNGVRSYVRGEGLWAKAQKDAVLSLEHYTYSRNEADYAAFRTSLEVFQGDGRARHALEQATPDLDIARAGFMEGGNAPEDVDALIWFFLNFSDISYMREAVGIWRQADVKMQELQSAGERIHEDLADGIADPARLEADRARLAQLGGELSVMENRFSVVLGEGARWVKEMFWLASVGVLLASTGIGLLVSRQIIASIGRAEHELKASESRFRSLKDSSTIGIASWTIDGRFTDANDLLLQMLGYTRKELEAGELYWKQMTPPEYRERDRRALAELSANGRCEPFEKVLLRKDGTRIPIYIGAATIGGDRTHGIAYILDISERKKFEEELRLAAVVFDSSSNGVLIADASMRILSVNEALCRMTGYTREELVGRAPGFLHSGYTTAAQYQAMWNALLNGGHWQGDILDRGKDGALLPLSVSISSVVADQNKATHFVAIMSDISERKAKEAQLWHIAHHDALTGLPNRTLFNDRIEQLIKQAARSSGQFAVLFYDLDRFKPVNDRYGHEIGDKLLKAVADRLKMHVRETDTVTRLGGDEFVVLLAGINGPEVAEQMLEKTVAAICQPCMIDGHAIELGVSAGMSIYPDHGTDADALIKHADAAMYHMKGRSAAREDSLPSAESA